MGNIDEKRLSALLERIGNMKAELEALENEVRALGSETQAGERELTASAGPVAEEAVEAVAPDASTLRQAQYTADSADGVEALDTPADDTPIEIDIPDISIPPIVEDPVAEYIAASSEGGENRVTGTTAEDIVNDHPATDLTEQVTGADSPVTEPESQVTEPVEVTSEKPESLTEEPVETVPDLATEPVEAEIPSESQTMDDLPFGDDLPMETEDEPLFKTDEAEQPQKPRKAIVDSTKAETAVMDVMADNQAWRTDRPGLQVKNVISAISLNDRVLLINVLFREDPLLFQNTISAFNAMTTLDEAVAYIQANFPEWDLNSEPVYRLMMAVRRKLR